MNERPNVDTGGGGHVSGGVTAGGNVDMGARTISGDEVHGDKHIHQYAAAPLPRYQSPQPPPPGVLADPGPLPPGSRIIYDRNPLFTGREEELRQLAALLLVTSDERRVTSDERRVTSEERSAFVTRHSTLVTISTGIGGIGKTQLAVEFAYRYGRYFAGGVQWASLADADPDAVGREVAECGARMGLWSPAEDTALSTAEKVTRTTRAWAGPEARLIIFDNCEDPALLAAWRPVGGGARVLVTSRSDDWPPGFAALAVPTLPREKSVALLEEYLGPAAPSELVGRQESPSSLVTLAAELGDLPLALTIAGSYLAAYPSIPIARYLAELRRPDLLARIRPPESSEPHSWTIHDMDVARTFGVSLARLEPEKSATDAAAVRLLAGATWLVHGEPFPRELLVGMLAEEAEAAPHLPDNAIRRLLALGLLERAGGRLRLHRLLAVFAAGALAGQLDATREAVEEAVIKLARQQDVRRDPRPLREWFIHYRHVVDNAFDREDERAAALYARLDFDLSNSGDLSGALPYSRRALAIRERVLGPEHPDTALSLNNLGYLLQAMGDLAAARPYLERALAINERVLGPEHPDTATSLNNLGLLLQEMGDLPAARPYYERALAIREHVLGPEHPDTASSLNNLGGLQQALGDLPAALPYFERALAINERVLGPEHPDTASSLNNMGALLYHIGDLSAARPYYKRALAIRERVLGPEHPNTATSLNNLGVLLRKMGELAAARPYYERALAIRERTLGPEHADTASSYNNLGALLQAMGDLPAARSYLERALVIWEGVLGLEHPDTAGSLNNLGMLLRAMGDLPAARSYYERALSILEAKLGPDHPKTHIVRNNLSRVS